MRHLFIAGILLLPGTVAAEIYRHVDAQGRITYTDQAPEAGSPLVLEPINTVPGRNKPRNEVAPARPPAAGSAASPAFTGYESLAVTGAANGSVLRNPGEPLTISAHAVPGLRPGHKLILRHNGTPANDDGSATATFTALDRGSHSFTAEIVDGTGNVLIQSFPATIQVHRHSAIKPGRAH